jgi:hypothetical protein
MEKNSTRLQLSRKKGFNLQKLSLETNRLPAKIVSRLSKFGNPLILKNDHIFIDASYRRKFLNPHIFLTFGDIDDVMYLYRRLWDGIKFQNVDLQYWSDKFKTYDLNELIGYNLACWCKLTDKCHADILLDILKNRK